MPVRKIESSGREGSARELRPGLTGAAALAATLLFYLALQPFPASTLNALFTQRGWVPYGISFLSAWAGGMLVVKFRLLGDHRRALQLDLLPRSLGERITPDNAGAFIEHLDAQPIAPGNPLCQRIRRGLLHFSARRDASQLVGQLGGQAQADADALESSYTLVRVFIWAVPILGFIGTVIGIGAAVGGFSESVGAAVDLDVMKESIGSVTGGLGIAFDTTLVALVMSILIMFPASSLQKAEEDFLAAVEDYTDEQLVVRLSGDDSESGDPRLIEQAIHREMAGHHAELRAWSERLGQIGEALSAQVVSGWEKIDAQLRVRQEQQQEQLARWAGEMVSAVQALRPPLVERLDQDGMATLFEEVELPLTGVLARMERAGVRVDEEKLAELSVEYQADLDAIERDVYRVTGEEFLISSPKQLQRILFDKLGLSPIKKTKTGYSTDEDVLEQLSAHHELPGRILAYRRLAKLKNTYVDALPPLVNERTGRIHTTFNQLGAATGRLSATHPNVQNIPIRTP